jgi:hypothetical protein
MQLVWVAIMLLSLSAAVIYVMHQFLMRRLMRRHGETVNVEPHLRMGNNDANISVGLDIDADVQALTTAVHNAVGDIDMRTAELKDLTTKLEALISLANERIQTLSHMLEVSPCIESSDLELAARTDTPQVLHMHQQGMKTADIARSLGMGQSEVELRLGVLTRLNR